MTKEINLTIKLRVSDTLYCSFMTSVSLASGLLIHTKDQAEVDYFSLTFINVHVQIWPHKQKLN